MKSFSRAHSRYLRRQIGLGAATSPLALRMGIGPDAAAQTHQWPGQQANFGRLIDVKWGRAEVCEMASATASSHFFFF